MGWLINLTLYTSAVLSLFVILIETEKGLKSDTATAKMRVFQIQGLKRQVFKGLQTLMSTLIKTRSSIWPKISFTDYIQTENDEQRILGEDIY